MPIRKQHDKLTDDQKSLVECNLPLVGYVVARIRYPPESVEDLFQIGAIGLMKAAQHFDSSKAQFQTYAYYCIVNEIRQARRYDNNPRRSTASTLSLDAQAEAKPQLLEQIASDEPTPEQQAVANDIKRCVEARLRSRIDEGNLSAEMTRAYLLDGKTQAQIAVDFKTSQSTVSRGIRETVKWLRRQLKEVIL